MNALVPEFEFESTWAESTWDTPLTVAGGATDENALQWLSNIGQGAATGAATGAVAGPWGALIGGLVGGGLGAAQTAMAQNQPAPPPARPAPAPASTAPTSPQGAATRGPFTSTPPHPAPRTAPRPVAPVRPVTVPGPRTAGPSATDQQLASVTTLLATLAPMLASLTQQMQQVLPQAGGPHLGTITVPPGTTLTAGGAEDIDPTYADEGNEAWPENAAACDCWSPEDVGDEADDDVLTWADGEGTDGAWDESGWDEEAWAEASWPAEDWAPESEESLP